MEKIIVEASIKDMILLNKIAQDNLQALNEANAAAEQKR